MLDDAIEHIVESRTLFVFLLVRVEITAVAVGGGAVGIVGIPNLRRPRKQRKSILESESLESLGRTLGRCTLGRCTLGGCTLGGRCWACLCCQRWHSLLRIVLFDCRRLNIRFGAGSFAEHVCRFLGRRTPATHVHWVRRWRMRVRGG